MPRSIDFDRFDDAEDKYPANQQPTQEAPLELLDDDTHVRMSDGVSIRREDVREYSGTFESSPEDEARRRTLDTIAFSSAAGLALVAIGAVVHHRSKKKQ